MTENNLSAEAQARVTLAKDALLLIQTRVIMPEMGTYIMQTTPYTRYTKDTPTETALKAAQCHACAAGVLFAAHALRRMPTIEGLLNALGEVDVGSRIFAPLREYFSEHQLGLIETAFEGEEITYTCDTNEAYDLATQFHTEHGGKASPYFLLEAILENIISNGGDFKP